MHSGRVVQSGRRQRGETPGNVSDIGPHMSVCDRVSRLTAGFALRWWLYVHQYRFACGYTDSPPDSRGSFSYDKPRVGPGALLPDAVPFGKLDRGGDALRHRGSREYKGSEDLDAEHGGFEC